MESTMECAINMMTRLKSLARRTNTLARTHAMLALLALAAVLPTTANAQALTLDFGLIRGTTTKNVCFLNGGWGTFWLTGSSSTTQTYVLASAPSVYVQWSNVCFAVKFDAAKGVSGTNNGTIKVNYLQSEYLVPITVTINTTARYSKPSKGYIAPKYKIMGVTYAPPGRSSNVTYGSESKVGNTTTLESSFSVSTGTEYTASVGLDISKWIPVNGLGVKVGGSSSSEFSITNTNKFETTIEKSVALTYQTNGPSCSGCDDNISVDHNYDVVWLWLNPLELFTTYSLEPKVVEWNGYGWNPKDPVAGVDLYPVLVGYLNGTWPTTPDRGVGAKLARAWAATGEVWQPGQGPGLTCADKGAIAKADPFAAYLDAACVRRASPYVMSSPFPVAGGTTADKRFTRLTQLPTVNYSYGAPITNLSIRNVNTTTVASGLKTSYTQSYSYDAGFKLAPWLLTIEANSKTKNSITATYSVNRSLTNSTTTSSGILITPPTNMFYPGYTQFAVFQDNVYGTFMFYPVPGS
ncbi:MAG: hypothetical protein E6Q88_12435 [Lysobacteraceae bacterium]|nr:MAG: hypothetical protein E6Q88_12435 [Xanthomonadaceae bacterium]